MENTYLKPRDRLIFRVDGDDITSFLDEVCDRELAQKSLEGAGAGHGVCGCRKK